VLGHLGNDCSIGNKYGNWTKDTRQPECGIDDEATKLINALPTGTIDGIIQGHRHKFAHHFLKGIQSTIKAFLIWAPLTEDFTLMSSISAS
jgi:UDP-2,3-diacylglucosamine pyrophosphatase LpxH